jgi:3-phosphoshikimate 1-carboxyvinyltransferase
MTPSKEIPPDRSIVLAPSKLRGRVEVPASKSDAHRLLIAAALADGSSEVAVRTTNEDIEATVSCLRALGAGIERTGNGFRVVSIVHPAESPLLDCDESGSTLRFLLPVAAALGCNARFAGRGRLPDRPLSDLEGELTRHGVAFSAARLPFALSGRLAGGEFVLPGNVSSQYVTGLLFALPLLAEGGTIRLASPLESAGYVEMTLRTLRQFSVDVGRGENAFSLAAGQRFRSPGAVAAEGDWSAAANWLAANRLGSAIELAALSRDSAQGDRAVEGILEGMRAGSVIDAQDIPDTVPALAVAAAGVAGTVEIRNIARLRLKESDRIATTVALLRALGGEAEEHPDKIVVHGTGKLRGGTADAAGDHRLAMAAAVASTICEQPVRILGAGAVAKSYPAFFDDFRRLAAP